MNSFKKFLNSQFLNEPAWAWAVFLVIVTIFLWLWGTVLGLIEHAAKKIA